jgi:hypothetical protein
MSGRYWVKLWVDILGDRKMAFLPDRLWRRFVEMLLIAKADDDDGRLPDLFWTARQIGISEEALESDLVELAKHGLIANQDGRWLIPKYEERQAAKGGGDRTNQHRRWQELKRSRNDPVTVHDRGEERRGEEIQIQSGSEHNAEATPEQSKQGQVWEACLSRFLELTGLREPTGPRWRLVERWYEPVAEIVRLASGDQERALYLIEAGVRRNNEQHLAFAAPQSIMASVNTIVAQEKLGSPKPQSRQDEFLGKLRSGG